MITNRIDDPLPSYVLCSSIVHSLSLSLGIEQASAGGHNIQHTRSSGHFVSDPFSRGGLPFLQPSGQGTAPKLPLLS